MVSPMDDLRSDGELVVVRTGRPDDELVEYLASPDSTFPDVATRTPEQVRSHFAALRIPGSVPPVHAVQNSHLATGSGSVAVRIYRKDGKASAVPALLWFHGGGWVLGDLETAELPARSLCAQTGCTVISVDYRLAPEHPFPAAYHDCFDALTEVVRQADALRVDASRIVVGGDSAGGNLAAAVAIGARDAGLVLAGQLLVYPVIEADFSTPTSDAVGEGYGLTTAVMGWFWDCYVPRAADRSDWRAAPAHAELDGTAAAFVYTCGFDPLAAEGIAYAAALRTAGVEVHTGHDPAAIHGVLAMDTGPGRTARAVAAQWVADRIG
jgi:acetyl esterase